MTFGDRSVSLATQLATFMTVCQSNAAKMSNTTALEDMVRMLVEERASREEEIVTERKLHQAEMEQREKLVTAQMQQMRDHMQALMDVVTSKEKAPPPRNSLEVKLVPLSAKDDIEAYLVTFELVMQAHEIPENRWPIHLTPQLTGKTQLAYVAFSPADVGDYSAVKAAILARYDRSLLPTISYCVIWIGFLKSKTAICGLFLLINSWNM